MGLPFLGRLADIFEGIPGYPQANAVSHLTGQPRNGSNVPYLRFLRLGQVMIQGGAEALTYNYFQSGIHIHIKQMLFNHGHFFLFIFLPFSSRSCLNLLSGNMTFRLLNTDTHHTLLVAAIAACIFVGLLYLLWQKGNVSFIQALRYRRQFWPLTSTSPRRHSADGGTSMGGPLFPLNPFVTSIGEQRSRNGCDLSSKLITSQWVRLRVMGLKSQRC